ncbi:MotA/TolQ/ExbB proton channel family protein [Nocardioides hungaricus]
MNDDVYQVIFRVAEVLELPVVILSLVALAFVLFEAGAYVAEAVNRRPRRLARIETAAAQARLLVVAGDRGSAKAVLRRVAWSSSMAETLDAFVDAAGDENLVAKHLADFDFGRQRRLGRTRLLVRAGPGLGLMGTLIPLSPALEGLAAGDVEALTENLRVAFSITVLGLLVGAIAFALSLGRDRVYGQDYSDLEYVAAVLTAPAEDTADDPAGGTADEQVPS